MIGLTLLEVLFLMLSLDHSWLKLKFRSLSSFHIRNGINLVFEGL